jgi:hypothetical protein
MNKEKFTDKEKREILHEQWVEEQKKKKNEERCDEIQFKKYGSGVFLI